MIQLNPDYQGIAARMLRNARLPATLIPALAKALAAGEPRMANPGEVLIEENSPGGELLLVSRGKVFVHITSLDGFRTKVAELQGPVMIGYLAALDGGERTACCTVARTALVLHFSPDTLQQMWRRTDPAAEAFRTLVLRAMTTHLASTSRQLATLNA